MFRAFLITKANFCWHSDYTLFLSSSALVGRKYPRWNKNYLWEKKERKANIFSDWSHKNKYVFFCPHSSWEAALLLAKRQAVMHPESPCKCWAGPRTECHLFEHRGGFSVPGWTLLLSCWKISQQWAVSQAAEFAPLSSLCCDMWWVREWRLLPGLLCYHCLFSFLFC